jgi:RNA polymerase sigma-70 factor (ECF subfamily)
MEGKPVSYQISGAVPGSDDAGLIKRAQDGDLAAFDQLVLRHQQEVFSIALRMLGDRDEAQEIAQDAFVRAYRAIGAFRGEAKLSTWLVSITMNLCRNRRRWWARRKRLIVASLDEPVDTEEGAMGHDVADPSPTPAIMAERRERRRYLLTALQSLDEASRTVVILRDLQGYSYEEIARVLHCRLGTVKSRLNRARLQLRALLDGKLS